MIRNCFFLILIASIAFFTVLTIHADTVPDTGQVLCYDSEKQIPCPQPGEPFFGQDANFSKNTPSYTKLDANGNDLPDSADEWVMVRDNVTSLIWEVKNSWDYVQDYTNPHDADNRYTWFDPNPATNGGEPGTEGDGTDIYDFIILLNSKSFGGYSDWRVPTIQELLTIVARNDPIISINKIFFPHTGRYRCWSSTTRVVYPLYAWHVDFRNGVCDFRGEGFNSNKNDDYYVRAVRGVY